MLQETHVACATAGRRELCTACSLARLIRCPTLGTPLPLVEKERVTVEWKNRITHAELERLDEFLRWRSLP